MPEAPQEVEFETTVEDWVAFSLYHASRSTVGRVLQWVVVAMGLLLAMMIGVPILMAQDPWAAAYHSLFWIVAVVLILAFPLWRRQLTKLVTLRTIRSGRNLAVLGKHRYSINADGVRSVGEHGESLVKWAAIERIVIAKAREYQQAAAAAGPAGN